MKVSEAQILTLKRIKSGTKYQVSGNIKYAREERIHGDVCCRSIVPLMRLNLIDFEYNCKNQRDGSLYYNVTLTEKGLIFLKENNDSK